MTPHLLIHGDACRLPLADGSVHCVVTSPPYWGLRDYGTATWTGGDPDCDHQAPTRQGQTGQRASRTFTANQPYRDICGKCGARRIDAQLGLEATPEEFVANMVRVFAEVRRVLRPDGTCWVNLGDSFSSGGRQTQCQPSLRAGQSGVAICPPVTSSLKPKDLVGIPWRVAFALQADGWYLRSDIIWAKPNPMPESVTDRPTKSHEYLFLLTKRERYYYDADAVREAAEYGRRSTFRSTSYENDRSKANGAIKISPVTNKGSDPTAGRNARSVWSIPSEAYPGAHFATFPRKLVEPCIKAGTSEKGCCPKCSAPWERVIERESFGKAFSATKFDESHQAGPLARSRNAYRANGMEGPPSPKMLGWRPTCTHDSPPVPSTVFDPFAGSGTTGVVALALGRRFVGVDLSSDYLAMAARRINRPHAPMVRIRDEEPLPLFSRFDA